MKNTTKTKQHIRRAYAVIISDLFGEIIHTFVTQENADKFYQQLVRAQKNIPAVRISRDKKYFIYANGEKSKRKIVKP